MLYMSITRRKDTWTVMEGTLEANGRMNKKTTLIKRSDWLMDFGSSMGPYPRATLVGQLLRE